MASRSNADAVLLPPARAQERTTPRSPAKIAKVVTGVRSKLDELVDKYEHLDDLLVGLLANDTGQADAIGALGAEVSRSRGELERLARLVDALGMIVRSHHRQNKRRDAELEVIAQRQESILRQLERASSAAPPPVSSHAPDRAGFGGAGFDDAAFDEASFDEASFGEDSFDDRTTELGPAERAALFAAAGVEV